MVQQKVTTMMHGIIQSSYQEIRKFKYVKELLILLCILGGIGSGFLLYRVYVVYREQAAQNALAQYVQEYYQIEDGQQADWQRMAELFQLGSEQQSNSYLAPYFLLFQVEALLRENKKEEALTVMDKLVEKSVHSPLLPLFKTKSALIKLDELDEVVQKSGLEELEELAENKKNKFRDTAQFYLGSYYWVNNSIVQAQKIWQTLVDDQYKEKLAPSPWVDLVKKKLEHIAE